MSTSRRVNVRDYFTIDSDSMCSFLFISLEKEFCIQAFCLLAKLATHFARMLQHVTVSYRLFHAVFSINFSVRARIVQIVASVS